MKLILAVIAMSLAACTPSVSVFQGRAIDKVTRNGKTETTEFEGATLYVYPSSEPESVLIAGLSLVELLGQVHNSELTLGPNQQTSVTNPNYERTEKIFSGGGTLTKVYLSVTIKGSYQSENDTNTFETSFSGDRQ